MSEEAGSRPVERFLQFLQVVANDPGLEDRVAALDQTDTVGLLEIAAANGFSFTIEEFREAVREVNGGNNAPDETGKVKGLDSKLPGRKTRLPLIINRTRNLN